jgi:hypothetical protein
MMTLIILHNISELKKIALETYEEYDTQKSNSGSRGTGSDNHATLTFKVDTETVKNYALVKFGVEICDVCRENRGQSLNCGSIF